MRRVLQVDLEGDPAPSDAQSVRPLPHPPHSSRCPPSRNHPAHRQMASRRAPSPNPCPSRPHPHHTPITHAVRRAVGAPYPPTPNPSCPLPEPNRITTASPRVCLTARELRASCLTSRELSPTPQRLASTCVCLCPPHLACAASASRVRLPPRVCCCARAVRLLRPLHSVLRPPHGARAIEKCRVGH